MLTAFLVSRFHGFMHSISFLDNEIRIDFIVLWFHGFMQSISGQKYVDRFLGSMVSWFHGFMQPSQTPRCWCQILPLVTKSWHILPKALKKFSFDSLLALYGSSTDLYRLFTDYLLTFIASLLTLNQLSTDYQLTSINSLLTSTDSIMTSTDSIMTSTDSLNN